MSWPLGESRGGFSFGIDLGYSCNEYYYLASELLEMNAVAWGCLLVLITLPAAASDRHRRRLGTAVGTCLSSRAGLCPQCPGLGTRLVCFSGFLVLALSPHHV